MIALHCSTAQALDVYADLCTAWAGVNGFGGHTAEIYAYRLWPYCPMGWQKMMEAETLAFRWEAKAIEARGREDLVILCKHARRQLPGVKSITIDGLPLDEWEEHTCFHHRAHVRIERQP